MCTEKELVVVDKQEIINYVKGIVQTAYLMGQGQNVSAKEKLMESIDNLPLVPVKDIKEVQI